MHRFPFPRFSQGMMIPKIRNAVPDDIDLIVQFNHRLAAETEDRELNVDVLRKGVTSALVHPERCKYFVAEIDGQVVGQTMITFEWSDWRNGCFWWIQSVYVQANFRRRGIFRQLY